MIKSDNQPIPLDAPWHLLFACAEWGVVVLVILGAWNLRRGVVGLGLTSVLVGGLALQVVASLFHLWPLGVARVTPLHAPPVISAMTVAGIACAWTAMRKSPSFRSPPERSQCSLWAQALCSGVPCSFKARSQ